MGTELKVTFVAGYPELTRQLDASPKVAQEMVDRMVAKAIGYGWGRIDAPGIKWPEHGGDALDFGTAYGLHLLKRSNTKDLRTAYNEWYETGEIS